MKIVTYLLSIGLCLAANTSVPAGATGGSNALSEGLRLGIEAARVRNEREAIKIQNEYDATREADNRGKDQGNDFGMLGPHDVKGWRETYWGMSPHELKQAHIGGLEESCNKDEGTCSYRIKGFELYGVPFSVSIYWVEGAKLDRVTVSLDTSYWQSDQTELGKKIETGLRAKYGRPKVINDNREHTEPNVLMGVVMPGYNNLELQWVFPSTTITYTQNHYCPVKLSNKFNWLSISRSSVL